MPTPKKDTRSDGVKKLLDPKWRLTTLYKIRTKVPGYENMTVTFAPNVPQQKLYQKIEDGHKRIIVLKPRKLGTTTGTVLYLLDKAMYSPNQMCRTIAHRKQTVTELFQDIVRFAFDRIPPELRPEIRYSTRSELDFANIGSKYSIDVEARGLTPTFLHLSEVAYVDDEMKLQDTIESVPLTATIIAESTANGRGNWFEKTFMRAWEIQKAGGVPDWTPMFFAWFEDPSNIMKAYDGCKLFYPDECAQLKSRFNLTDDQVLWWDRKKNGLRERMSELYPSTPEEAFLFSTGRVYDKEFSHELNVIPAGMYTPTNNFKVSMDYGQTNPMVFQFWDQDYDGNHILFKEFYKQECPIEDAAAWLKSQGVTKVHYADPSIFSNTQVSVMHKPGQKHRYSIADEFKRHGIALQRAQNDVLAGIQRVKEYLRFDPEHPHPFKTDEVGRVVKGSPRIFITEDCTETLREFSRYRWPKNASGNLNQSAYETPIKADDHAMDAMRYYILSHAKPLSVADEDVERNTPAYFMKIGKNHRKKSLGDAY